LLTTITAPDARKGDQFGASVFFQQGSLVVGAPSANLGAIESAGKAYIFKRIGTDLVHHATLKAGNGSDNDNFGHAVIMSPAGAIISSLYATYRNFPQHGRLYFFDE
ncbi:MAG TPA: hypothetical protein VK907_12890, partial [Phnomibacter sp.]|nr:hypothetical protein [Phnomibacter sp.]